MIAIHVTYWNRWPLERITSRCLARFAGSNPVVAVISPEDPYYDDLKPHLESLDFDVIEYPNTPVSDKHNAGALHIYNRYQCDMLQVGSDDVFFDGVMHYYNNIDAELMGTQQCFFWQPSTGRTIRFGGYRERKDLLGPGRLIPYSLLDKVKGYVWPPGYDKSLDGRSFAHLDAPTTVINEPLFVDIKTPVNISDFDKLYKNNPSVALSDVQQRLHPDDWNLLQQLCA